MRGPDRSDARNLRIEEKLLDPVGLDHLRVLARKAMNSPCPRLAAWFACLPGLNGPSASRRAGITMSTLGCASRGLGESRRRCGMRRVWHGLGRNSPATEVGVDGAGLQLGHALLRVLRQRDAPRDRPPVVERLGDVADPVGALGEAEQQLEVLDRVEVRVEATHLGEQLPAGHEQVADVHRAQRVDGRPVGLVERIDPGAVRGDLVLVGVGDVELALRELHRDPQQGIGRELVVVVQEGDELAAAELEPLVGGRRDARVLAQQACGDPRISRYGPLHGLAGVRAR